VKVTLGLLEDDDAASEDPGASEETVEPDEEGQDPGADDQTEQTPDTSENDGEEQAAPDDTQQAAPVTEGLIGVELTLLDDAQRKSFSIAEGVEGVLITRVLPGSKAEGKGLKAGDVIVEVAQEFMRTPQQVAEKLTKIKSDGRRSGYLMIADKEGNLRLVAVPLE
jgi:serine protease Do